MGHHGTGRRRRSATGGLALALGLLLGGKAQGAVVTILDCVNDPHIVKDQATGSTRIDVGTDDLELACALTPASKVGKVILRGQNITISGNILTPARFLAIDVDAKGTLEVNNAEIHATDGNGDIRLNAVGNVLFEGATVRVGNANLSGDEVTVTCTGAGGGVGGAQVPPCTITARRSDFEGRKVTIMGQGDVYFGLVEVTTRSPRDRIVIASAKGSCLLNGCGNVLRTGREGTLSIQAAGRIDFAFAQAIIARDIDMTSGIGDTPRGLQTDIRLTGATVRNDFGKRGNITITADEGTGEVNICGATLVDDDTDVSKINGRELVPHEPFNNIVGPPDVDE